MGRKAVIDQEQILDAAEFVVARDGAARLTLEAVAERAGISKGSVLYGFKSKQALIEAVVRRAVERDNALNTAAAVGMAGLPGATIRGRIAAAETPFPSEFTAVALSLIAALAQDGELRSIMQDNQAATIRSVTDDSDNPRGALLAYLALEGLKFLESLDFHHWPPQQRSRILAEIAWLVDARPVPAGPSPHGPAPDADG